MRNFRLDIQYHFLPGVVVDHGRATIDTHAFQAHVGPMRPTSRGVIRTMSKHPFIHPYIYANYLSTENDRQEMRDCVRISREIFAQKAFDEFRDVEITPGAQATSVSDIDAFVRAKSDSAYHPSGTCKMGSPDDRDAVVDARTLKVFGVDNLRVVDASIMPSVVSGNLNAPVIMMAEKAADIIRDRPPLPKLDVPVWTPNGTRMSVRN